MTDQAHTEANTQRGVYYTHRPEMPHRPHRYRVSDPHTGKMVSKSFSTRAEGDVWAEGMRGGLRNRTVANGRVPWALAVEDYVADLTDAGRNEKYIRTVARVGADLLTAGASDITGERFRPLVQQYITGLVTAPGSRQPGLPMSAATRRTSLAIVRAIVHAAVDKYRIPFDPVGGIKAPKVRKEMVDTMTIDEVRLCLRPEMESHTYFMRFAILAYLGVRDRGEGLMLRWDDYDPTRRQIRIRYQDEVELKTGEREVPVPGELAAIFKHAPKLCPWILPDEIRQGANGKMVGDKTDYQRFKAFLRDSWIHEDIRPQDRERVENRIRLVNRKAMRHLYARMMAATGVALSTLKERMGHTSISTTTIYAEGSASFESVTVGWPRGELLLRGPVAQAVAL